MNILEKLEYRENESKLLENDCTTLNLRISDLKSLKEDLSFLLLLPNRNIYGNKHMRSYLYILKYLVVKDEVIKIIESDIKNINEEIKDLTKKLKNIVNDIRELRRKIIILESSNYEEISRLREERKSREENGKIRRIKEIEEFYDEHSRNISEYDLHRGER